MQVFNAFVKIAKKKFVATLMYLAMFLVLISIMSKLTQKTINTQFQASELSICINDEDQSTASEALTDYLSSIHKRVILDSYDSETLQDYIFFQKIDFVVTIPKGFEKNLVDGHTDQLLQTSKLGQSAGGYFAEQQIDTYLSTVLLYQNGGFTLEESLDKTLASLENASEVKMINFSDTTATQRSDIFYYFQFVPYTILLMLILGLSPILITFRKKDLGARINCSSLSQTSRNTQLITGCIAYSVFLWIVFMVVALILYHPDQLFSTNGLLCILNSFVFLLIGTSITLLISTFPLSSNALNMVANVVTLSMSFLTGIFVPQWYLGSKVLSVSRFLPTYWYIRSNNMIGSLSSELMDMKQYWLFLGIQFAFVPAILAIYLICSKQRKHRS